MSSIQQSLLEKVLKAQVAQNFLNDNISEQEIAERVELMVKRKLKPPLMTDKVCKLALERDGVLIRDVPKALKTEKLYEIAVQQAGMALKLIHSDFRTQNICSLAFKQNIDAFKYFSDKFKTPDICLEIMERKFEGELAGYIPDETITEQFLLKALEKNLSILNYTHNIFISGSKPNIIDPILQSIKKSEIFPELCQTAVKNDRANLEYVPKEIQTIKFCKTILEQNGLALKHIHGENRINPKLILEAVKQNGIALAYVGEKLRNPNVCLTAFLQNNESLKFAPKWFKDVVANYKPEEYSLFNNDDFYEASIKVDPDNFKLITKDQQTERICITAFELKPELIRQMRPDLLEEEEIQSFINDNFETLQKATSFEFMQMVADRMGVNSDQVRERQLA